MYKQNGNEKATLRKGVKREAVHRIREDMEMEGPQEGGGKQLHKKCWAEQKKKGNACGTGGASGPGREDKRRAQPEQLKNGGGAGKGLGKG